MFFLFPIFTFLVLLPGFLACPNRVKAVNLYSPEHKNIGQEKCPRIAFPCDVFIACLRVIANARANALIHGCAHAHPNAHNTSCFPGVTKNQELPHKLFLTSTEVPTIARCSVKPFRRIVPNKHTKVAEALIREIGGKYGYI